MSRPLMCDNCKAIQDPTSLEVSLWFTLTWTDGGEQYDACSRGCARDLFDAGGPFDLAEQRMLEATMDDDVR